MNALARSRELVLAIADGNPPAGWPRIAGDARAVPKCHIVLCCEPGRFNVQVRDLAGAEGSFAAAACLEHLEHFAAAAVQWVTPG